MDQAQAKLLDGLEDLREIGIREDRCAQVDRVKEKLLEGLEDVRRLGADRHFGLQVDQLQSKLLKGLEDLRKIGANPHLYSQVHQIEEQLLLAFKEQTSEIYADSPRFDLAFYKINGALEDRFEHLIKSHPNVSDEELTRIKYRHSRWVELTNSMQRHYGLSDADRSRIVDMNGYRSDRGYGGEFIRKYPDVDKYAQFVCKLMEKY